MALISCSECNARVSDRATSCPQCGASVVNATAPGPTIDTNEFDELRPRRKKGPLVAAAIGALVLAGGVGAFALGGGESKPKKSATLMEICQGLAKKEIVSNCRTAKQLFKDIPTTESVDFDVPYGKKLAFTGSFEQFNSVTDMEQFMTKRRNFHMDYLRALEGKFDVHANEPRYTKNLDKKRLLVLLPNEAFQEVDDKEFALEKAVRR